MQQHSNIALTEYLADTYIYHISNNTDYIFKMNELNSLNFKKRHNQHEHFFFFFSESIEIS